MNTPKIPVDSRNLLARTVITNKLRTSKNYTLRQLIDFATDQSLDVVFIVSEENPPKHPVTITITDGEVQYEENREYWQKFNDTNVIGGMYASNNPANIPIYFINIRL